ncbi:hypothetical protein IWW34DRAFT_857470 [Fusarium oxysporum f. sp. albedinis]|nr:hypothetical protein IWW34DRAFT_857470 [Fusarium oxysporum f. sp. albedinis]KAK2469016.1 hypothetical protein H9L39_19284 [Fusarium oxysporum f. sp. albedinis]
MPLRRRTAHLVFTASILPGRHLKPKLKNLLLASFHSHYSFSLPEPCWCDRGPFAIVLLEERLAVLDGGLVEVGALGGEGRDGVSERGLRQGLLVHGNAGSEFIDPGAAARAAWVVEHEAASTFRIDRLGTITSWNREKWRGNASAKHILAGRFRLRPNWRA